MPLVLRQSQRVLPLSIGAIALLIGLLVVSGSAGAADEPATATTAKQTPSEQMKAVWDRDLLTGDWEGWRTNLQEHGIDPHFRLSQYGQWVADGGVETNGGYGGTMDYRVDLDLNKLFGMWEGLSVSMHARTRFGQDVTADAGAFALTNGGMLMPAPGNYSATDVTGLTVSQYLPFFGGRLANVTIGKLDVIDTVTGLFPWVGFGQEGFWNANAFDTVLPWFGAVQGLSLYGGMAVTVNQEFQAAETGFLATGTQGVSTSWNSVQDSFDDGVWMAGFHRFFWKMEDKPGWLMVFAAGSTKDQSSNDPRDFTIIPGQGIVSTKEDKPWDIALVLHQVFWKDEEDPNRKATIVIGATGGPDDPQFAQWNIFAAIEAYGPMESRPLDRMGVSGWHSWLADNFKDLVAPVSPLRDTWGVEIYYNIAINKWLHVTPDIQFVKNEIKGDDLAIVPGIRTVIDF